MAGNQKDRSPIFIVGCGRSGTTLLRTILNHHRDVAIPLESLFIIDYLRTDTKIDLETAKDLIIREFELKEWGIDINRKELKDLHSIKEIIGFLHDKYAGEKGKSIWGQKTPRFIRYWALLLKYYPDALFIHLVRDPRAVVASFIRSKAHRSNAFFASKRWVRDVQAGQDLKRQISNQVIELKYETLVSNTREVLLEICDFIGIPFDENMLLFHRTGYSEYSEYYHSLHDKLGRLPDSSRIETWRNYLTLQQQALIEQICSPLMQDLGYERETQSSEASQGYLFLLFMERLYGLFMQIKHYSRYRRKYIQSYLRRKYRLGLLIRDITDLNF